MTDYKLLCEQLRSLAEDDKTGLEAFVKVLEEVTEWE